MIVYSDQTSSLIPGNTIQCFGTLKNFATASNPGEFDQKQYYRELNFYYQLYADQIEVVSGHSNILFTKMDEIRHQLSTSIESGLPDKQAGIMQAVLLGQKTELPSDIKQLYQQNGIGHLLAISGLHVTIFCFGIFRLLLICRLPRRISILATISFLISYGLMTGFSISTSRAVIMMLFYSQQICCIEVMIYFHHWQSVPASLHCKILMLSIPAVSYYLISLCSALLLFCPLCR